MALDAVFAHAREQEPADAVCQRKREEHRQHGLASLGIERLDRHVRVDHADEVDLLTRGLGPGRIELRGNRGIAARRVLTPDYQALVIAQ